MRTRRYLLVLVLSQFTTADCRCQTTPSIKDVAWAEFDASHYKVALSNFNTAVVLEPQDPNVYCGRGMAKWQLQDFRGAVADYDKAIALNPACGGYYCNRGQAKFSLKLVADALNDYKKAIELDPKNSQAYYNRGILETSGLTNLTAAVEDFTRAIEMHNDPREADIFFWRGNARLQTGDYDRAIADYGRAMALGPGARYAADLRTNLALATKLAHTTRSNKTMQPAPR